MFIRLRRALARWLAALSCRIDVPEQVDTDAIVARQLELLAHVEAGRIRRRRGESNAAFAGRVVRGDFVLNENLIDFSRARQKRASR